MKLSSIQKGVGLTVLAWTLLAMMSAFAKYSYRYVPMNTTFLFQNFGALCLVTPLFLSMRKPLRKPSSWPTIFARALFGASAFYSLLWSLGRIPLTDGNVLNNTAPLFVPLILYFWLKKKSSGNVWLGTLIGFLGVLLILKPSGQIFQWSAIGALYSGFASGVVMVLVRRLAGDDPRVVILAYLSIASLCIFPFAAPELSAIPLEALPVLLTISFLFGCSQFVYTKSMHYAEPTVLGPFSYTYVAVSGLIDWFVWNNPPNLLSLMGIALIIGGGIFIIFASRKATMQKAEEISAP